MKYQLTLYVEHRATGGRVVHRSEHQGFVVQGIDTAPLAEFQAQHPGQSIGFEYGRVPIKKGAGT